MKKNTKTIVFLVSLSLSFFICGVYKNNIYALNQESKIDLLIENKKEQENLQEQITKLEQEINNKIKTINEIENNFNDNNTEVVTVSFIKEESSVQDKKLALENSIKNDISTLKSNIENNQNQLENYMIEGVKLEKYIQEEKQSYLEDNNLQYTPGIWPLESYTALSSAFGNRIHPISGKYKFHKGVDIPAPQDTDILASDDGIVMFSGFQNGYGNIVKIKHFDGKETIYAHAIYNIAKEGDIVKKGQVVSKVGSTGNSTGNHLHFEVIVKGEIINPLTATTK
ncbi:MAG: peptidoglycan DD-metalloendopeptidase family protein [Fusobacteriaceae bacterium]